MTDHQDRHAPAHPWPVITESTIIYLTICANNRAPTFANESIHALLRSAWTEADFWKVGRYVVMPDHIHLFCAPALEPATDLRRWVGYWKGLVTKGWVGSKPNKVFQTNFWDRQLRQVESYEEKWGYVLNNPVRQGLVSKASDWPFQGEMNVLEW